MPLATNTFSISVFVSQESGQFGGGGLLCPQPSVFAKLHLHLESDRERSTFSLPQVVGRTHVLSAL